MFQAKVVWLEEGYKMVIGQKLLDGKIFYYSVLESPRDKLQEYAIKNRRFHLRN